MALNLLTMLVKPWIYTSFILLQVCVEIRVVFLKIGEIDTLKEIYHADAFIQAKWREPRLDGKTDEVSVTQHKIHAIWMKVSSHFN